MTAAYAQVMSESGLQLLIRHGCPAGPVLLPLHREAPGVAAHHERHTTQAMAFPAPLHQLHLCVSSQVDITLYVSSAASLLTLGPHPDCLCHPFSDALPNWPQKHQCPEASA